MKLKKIFTSPFLWAFFVGIASIHLVKELSWARRSAPEPLVIVDDWSLTDQNGKTLGKRDLLGKIIVADFFFTSCPTICPKLTDAMKKLYERLGTNDKVHFVSITVDPEVDTPEVLKNFMMKSEINSSNWHCLTGSKQEIYSVVVDKMRVHMGDKQIIAHSDGAYDIPHLAHLALFDQNGDLRGLFKTEDLELASLVRSANFLLEKKTP